MKNFASVYICCLLFILVETAAISTGCSGNSSKTVSTTETRRDIENNDAVRHESTPTVEVTRTEETTKEESHRGGFFSIVGDIIALPFRAIASIL
ncbi:MAG: hypothetical protein KBC84_00380 [Proteobacteria bacterium]|nr:hypothetical protein [Pseudomonadota bacterium]